MTLDSIADIRAVFAKMPSADEKAARDAVARNGVLTKPPGALGRFEDIAIWYAGWRANAAPEITSPQVIVFAGNHGVAAQGVSAFPAEVTAQMVLNFEHGGAAINQLCKTAGANLSVIPLELDNPTADFTQGPALDDEGFVTAFNAGWDAVDPSSDLLVVGEMGIGNTTAGAAILYALYGDTPQDWAGRGTGVDDTGVALKASVIEKAVSKNSDRLDDGLSILQALGGRELVAMAGAVMRARIEMIPVIMDGFICTAALACLHNVDQTALDHVIAGHRSNEGAHSAVLAKLGKDPILDLGLRLGEASGGAAAILIVKAALACHSGMATFAEAGVSDG